MNHKTNVFNNLQLVVEWNGRFLIGKLHEVEDVECTGRYVDFIEFFIKALVFILISNASVTFASCVYDQ